MKKKERKEAVKSLFVCGFSTFQNKQIKSFFSEQIVFRNDCMHFICVLLFLKFELNNKTYKKNARRAQNVCVSINSRRISMIKTTKMRRKMHAFKIKIEMVTHAQRFLVCV